MSINSVTLLGSSSGRNAGDAALIAGIMDATDKECGRKITWEIPTIRPSYIRDNYQNRTVPISMMPWSLSVKMFGVPTYRSIMRTDLSLIFDAILFDRALYNPLFNYLSTVATLLPLAKKRGKLLGYYNVGVGPVNTGAGKEMLRRLTDIIDFVTVRDQDSFDILRDIGVENPNILISADAALNVRSCSDERTKEILQNAGFSMGEEILAINLSKYIDTWAGAGTEPLGREKFLKIYAAALDTVLEKIKVPLLLVCTQVHDIELSKQLMDLVTKAPKKGIISNDRYNHYDIKGVLGNVSLLCGMRLHATILASAGLTPILGIPHQPKVGHYFKTAGVPERILTFKDFTESALIDFFLRGWSERRSIKARLEDSIPKLKERALIPARMIAELNRGGSITSFFEDRAKHAA